MIGWIISPDNWNYTQQDPIGLEQGLSSLAWRAGRGLKLQTRGRDTQYDNNARTLAQEQTPCARRNSGHVTFVTKISNRGR